MKVHAPVGICAMLLACACLSGCGSSNEGPALAPPIAAKPDVNITFGGANHMCVVALYSEQQGSTIPCAELVQFMKDELRLGTGAIYDTHGADADPAEAAAASKNLQAAGYRFLGGHR